MFGLRTVYADVVLAVNFAADYLIMYISGRALSLKVNGMKIAAASVAGALFALACELYMYDSTAQKLVLGILMIPVMCKISYKTERRAAFLKLCFVFVFVSLSFGGGMQLLSRILIGILAGKKNFSGGIDARMFVLFSGIMTAVMMLFRRISGLSKMPSETADVVISFDGQTERGFSLLCDTGNVLTDPYSSLPVIIIKSACAQKAPEIADIARGIVADKDAALVSRVRYIPVRTACGTSVFCAVRPKSAFLKQNGGKLCPLDTVVAFDTGEDDTYCGTDGLFPYELSRNI